MLARTRYCLPRDRSKTSSSLSSLMHFGGTKPTRKSAMLSVRSQRSQNKSHQSDLDSVILRWPRSQTLHTRLDALCAALEGWTAHAVATCSPHGDVEAVALRGSPQEGLAPQGDGRECECASMRLADRSSAATYFGRTKPTGFSQDKTIVRLGNVWRHPDRRPSRLALERGRAPQGDGTECECAAMTRADAPMRR
jgi:hypothetical protein